MTTPAAVNSPSARDLAYVLHPYTNARAHEAKGPVIIERGQGIYVYDDQGREYIEGLAGLWSVAIGYGEERLVEAAAAQMRKLPYYHTFSHKSHNPGIDLAEKLISIAPAGLARVFFANSGSEANDTVVKLVWYYNNALGRPKKKKIISRLRAYHGITIASGSLTGLPWNHRDFDLPIANILHTACPHHYRYANDGESEEEFASRLAGQLEEMIVHEGPDTVAAFIGEPVMGAGGVLVPPRTYWQKISQVCRKYDVLIIADEVINGFGRTGRMFASELYGIEPDMLVVSKQITSSYLPLSAILLTDGIYQTVALACRDDGVCCARDGELRLWTPSGHLRDFHPPGARPGCVARSGQSGSGRASCWSTSACARRPSAGSPPSSPMATSAGSRSRARSPRAPRCCCSTSRQPA